MIRSIAVVALLLVGACAVAVEVDQFGPDFDGSTATRMRGNVLPTPVEGIGAIELNAERVTWPERPEEYALLVEVRAQGLRIRSGKSLRLVMDGDTTLLARDSTATYWMRVDPTIEEQARYPASDIQMRRLAGAAEVRMAVRGAGWWEERRLSPQNLEVLRGFVGLYVRPDSAASPDTATASTPGL